jgi:hypothetical protein
LGPQGVPLREVFKVYPDSADIAPGGSATFKIAVRPAFCAGTARMELKEQIR